MREEKESALEDVALVGLNAETGNVAHVGWQQLRQLLDVAALQLPSPFLRTAETDPTKTQSEVHIKTAVFKSVVLFWVIFQYLSGFKNIRKLIFLH